MTNKPEQGTEIPLLRKELAATNERLEALVEALVDWTARKASGGGMATWGSLHERVAALHVPEASLHGVLAEEGFSCVEALADSRRRAIAERDTARRERYEVWENAARIVEAHIITGRAWTEEQEQAAKMLMDVAAAIRARASALLETEKTGYECNHPTAPRENREACTDKLQHLRTSLAEAQEEVARLKRERDSWDDAHAAVCAQLETVVSERNALRNSIAKLKSEWNHTEERSARRNQSPAAISERIAKLERAVNEAKRLLTYPYCGTNSEFSRHRDAWLKEHES
jgi:hypothetical protein